MARLQHAEQMMAKNSNTTELAAIPEEADRKVAREPKRSAAPASGAKKRAAAAARNEGEGSSSVSKIDQLIAMLRRQKGVTVMQLAETVGWQKHSVRGAMSGVLKKRGLAVKSEKVKGQRLYRLAG